MSTKLKDFFVFHWLISCQVRLTCSLLALTYLFHADASNPRYSFAGLGPSRPPQLHWLYVPLCSSHPCCSHRMSGTWFVLATGAPDCGILHRSKVVLTYSISNSLVSSRSLTYSSFTFMYLVLALPPPLLTIVMVGLLSWILDAHWWEFKNHIVLPYPEGILWLVPLLECDQTTPQAQLWLNSLW